MGTTNTTDTFARVIGIIGACTGIIGLILGIYNAWYAHRKEQIRIKGELYVYLRGQRENFLGIEIKNVGGVTAYVGKVVISAETDGGVQQYNVNGTGERKLPYKLCSHTSLQYPDEIPADKFPTIKSVSGYIETQCGKKINVPKKRFKAIKRKPL